MLAGFVFIASASAGLVSTTGLQNRISNGEAAKPNEFPWQVSLQVTTPIGEFKHFCGGVIINQLHIVTAAHCINDKQPSDLKVIAGLHHLSSHTKAVQSRKIAKLWMHENYNKDKLQTHDIAVLELDKPLQFDQFVKSIKMTDKEPTAGTICIASGWGRNATTISNSKELQHVEIPIIDKQQCQKKLNYKDNTKLCAGIGNKGVCKGDSGGPLICPVPGSYSQFQLVGVSSYGWNPCGNPKYPTVFANIATLKAWIDGHVA